MSYLDKLIEQLSDFNRFYTVMQGFFEPKFLDTDYSVVEIRILYEIYNNPGCTAKKLTQTLRLDKGYISHRIKEFEKKGFISKENLTGDKRVQSLYLTIKGEKLVSELTDKNNQRLASMLKELSEEECAEMSVAMDTIMRILSKERN